MSVKNCTCVTLVRIHTASMSLWVLKAVCMYSTAAPARSLNGALVQAVCMEYIRSVLVYKYAVYKYTDRY